MVVFSSGPVIDVVFRVGGKVVLVFRVTGYYSFEPGLAELLCLHLERLAAISPEGEWQPLVLLGKPVASCLALAHRSCSASSATRASKLTNLG